MPLTAALTSDVGLAEGTLRSVAASDRIQFHFGQGVDFTALNVATSDQPRDSNGVSEELRFISRGDRSFRYVFSAYYGHTRKGLSATHAWIYVSRVDMKTFLPYAQKAHEPCVTEGSQIHGLIGRLV